MQTMASGVECAKCSKEIRNDGKHLICATCKNAFHLTKNCAGVSESTFTAMSQVKRDNWICRSCRNNESLSVPSPAHSSAPNPSKETGSLREELASMNAKLEALLSLKQSVDSLEVLPAKLDELLALGPIVECLQTTVKDVQTSIADFSAKYNSLLTLATSNNQTVKALQAEVSDLQAKVQSQATEILKIRTEQNDSEQYSRLANMELHGLPTSPGENLVASIAELASKLSIAKTFQCSDIQEVHRLPGRRDGIAPVLIRFSSVSLKEAWMAERGALRLLSQTGGIPRLYFNDNLTRANKELFWLARQKGKAQGYKFVWVKRGKIFAKKSEGSDLIRVNQITDIDSIV